MGQQEGEEEEGGGGGDDRKREEDAPVISFSPDGRIEGGVRRRRSRQKEILGGEKTGVVRHE